MSLGLEQVSIDKRRELGTMSICYVIRIRTSVDRQALSVRYYEYLLRH